MKKILMLATMLCLTTGAYAEAVSYKDLYTQYAETADSPSRLEEMFKAGTPFNVPLQMILGERKKVTFQTLPAGAYLTITNIGNDKYDLVLQANDGFYYLEGVKDGQESEYELEGEHNNCSNDAKVQIKFAEYKDETYLVMKYSASRTLWCPEMGHDIDNVYGILYVPQPEEKK